MEHFFIITNTHKDAKKALTKKLKEYIEKKGGTVAVITAVAARKTGSVSIPG